MTTASFLNRRVMASFLTLVLAGAAVVPAANAGVRVWVSDAGDVFPSYDDVVISVRAERDCYATVFVVDTEGYVHVIDPFARQSRWLRGARTYRYSAATSGLHGLRGRGIAFVFAVASPQRLDYSTWYNTMSIGSYGYRVQGDPLVAFREFYTPMIAPGCDRGLVSVSYARFYIQDWVRYPSYLCGTGATHVRLGDHCRTCAPLYESYRLNLASAHDVIRPTYPASRVAVRHETRIRVVTPAERTVVVRRRGDAVRYESVRRTRIVSTNRLHDRVVRQRVVTGSNDEGDVTQVDNSRRRIVKRTR